MKQLQKKLHNNNLTITKAGKGKTIVIIGKERLDKKWTFSYRKTISYNWTKIQQIHARR
jgi:hypothetical protein